MKIFLTFLFNVLLLGKIIILLEIFYYTIVKVKQMIGTFEKIITNAITSNNVVAPYEDASDEST